jgi:hypothetical protein
MVIGHHVMEHTQTWQGTASQEQSEPVFMCAGQWSMMPVSISHPEKVAVQMRLTSLVFHRINSVGPVLYPYLIGTIEAIDHVCNAHSSHACTFAVHVHDHLIM